MKINEAEKLLMVKVDRAWIDRALGMFRHMTNSLTTVSGLRVAKGWPLRGSITFTRDADGRRVRMYLKGNKWKAVAK